MFSCYKNMKSVVPAVFFGCILIISNLWEVAHWQRKPQRELSHRDDAGLLKRRRIIHGFMWKIPPFIR